MPHKWGHRFGGGNQPQPPSNDLSALRGLSPEVWRGIQAIAGNLSPDPTQRVEQISYLTQLQSASRATGRSLDDILAAGVVPDRWLDGGGGGGGSTWRPGEYELMLREFGLDERTFDQNVEEQNRRFGLDEEDVRTRNYIDALLASLEGESVRGGLDLRDRELQEAIRTNRAREQEDSRRRALDAARDALSSYLRATELADARRIAALSEQRALLPFMVDPSQQYFTSPTGPLAQAAGSFGLPFEPSPIQHMNINPQEQLGAGGPVLDPQAQSLLDMLQGLGGGMGA